MSFSQRNFLKILHHSSVSWNITLLYIFRSNVICFAQKEPIKVEILRNLSVQVKIHQIIVSFETSNQFFFEFCITLPCHETWDMRHETYTLNKRSLSKSKFGEIFCGQSKVWNFEFWWISLAQIVYSYSQKSTEDLSLMTLNSDAKFNERRTCVFKYDMRNFFSMSSFCPRFELQKYRGVIFHDIEQWCKKWINPDLVVSKMTWGIGWTFIRASKSLKNCSLIGFFYPKHIMFQLQNFIGIMCHETDWWCQI